MAEFACCTDCRCMLQQLMRDRGNNQRSTSLCGVAPSAASASAPFGFSNQPAAVFGVQKPRQKAAATAASPVTSSNQTLDSPPVLKASTPGSQLRGVKSHDTAGKFRGAPVTSSDQQNGAFPGFTASPVPVFGSERQRPGRSRAPNNSLQTPEVTD